MSDVTGDYDQYVANSHEQAMKETRVEIAKIEAKRDVDKAKIERDQAVKTAKINNEDRTIAKCVIAFFIMVAIIVGCIVFRPERQKNPEELRIDQQNYETCMKYEEDEAVC